MSIKKLIDIELENAKLKLMHSTKLNSFDKFKLKTNNGKLFIEAENENFTFMNNPSLSLKQIYEIDKTRIQPVLTPESKVIDAKENLLEIFVDNLNLKYLRCKCFEGNVHRLQFQENCSIICILCLKKQNSFLSSMTS